MFLVIIFKGQDTDIMTYESVIKRLDMQPQHESELEDNRQLLLFCDITDHRTIKATNSSYEVMVNWEDSHVTWERVSVIRCDDPIYLAKYARCNDLPDNPVWKQLHCYINNTNKMNHFLKASKAKHLQNIVRFSTIIALGKLKQKAL